ncbi:MAG: hypothetical protein H0W67_04485, partial [Gemmatimonadales bacterium]|nr:hypothetical protein [Gemmatimonadales bacterium]
MTGPTRDWDKELGDIDKAIERHQTAPPATPLSPPPVTPVSVPHGGPARGTGPAGASPSG